MRDNDYFMNEEDLMLYRFIGYSGDYDHYVDIYDVAFLDDKIMKVIDFL